MLKWSSIVNHINTKDLFQLQTELIDMKVDMASSKAIDRFVEQTSKAIDRVVEQISQLKNEMHELRGEMRDGFAAHDKRLVAIETKLGMVNERQKEIRNKFIDYSFKAGWLILSVVISYTLVQWHALIQ